MYKKSITRIEKDNETNQAELSNPALHDIIATNHVVLAKKPREERLSRACKAVIIMIILGLIAIGIIILTVALAHSRNSLMAIVTRSAETNMFETLNNTPSLFINHENLTTIANEQVENENWQKTTVNLTSNNLHTLTTQNIHISSSIMRTKQRTEHIPLTTQSMKSYPSLSTIANEQSTIFTTIQTTVSNEEIIYVPSSHHSTATMTPDADGIITTMKSQEYTLTSSNNPQTSIFDSTSPLIQDITTTMPEETSFTIFITRYFNIQSSTKTPTDNATQKSKLAEKLKADIDEDAMDDLLFS
ncbi:unnamed protein product [Adineta steineri]|uniref:Uncharacterized protein n=1 Tax=Adineta steineri TaxID=433720 RepID=A0A814GGW7_9BILA|nr:unnamed protein product [Adineta steineri]